MTSDSTAIWPKHPTHLRLHCEAIFSFAFIKTVSACCAFGHLVGNRWFRQTPATLAASTVSRQHTDAAGIAAQPPVFKPGVARWFALGRRGGLGFGGRCRHIARRRLAFVLGKMTCVRLSPSPMRPHSLQCPSSPMTLMQAGSPAQPARFWIERRVLFGKSNAHLRFLNSAASFFFASSAERSSFQPSESRIPKCGQKLASVRSRMNAASGLSTLVVKSGVVVLTVFAAVEVGAAVRTGVATTDFDTDLDSKICSFPQEWQKYAMTARS